MAQGSQATEKSLKKGRDSVYIHVNKGPLNKFIMVVYISTFEVVNITNTDPST